MKRFILFFVIAIFLVPLAVSAVPVTYKGSFQYDNLNTVNSIKAVSTTGTTEIFLTQDNPTVAFVLNHVANPGEFVQFYFNNDTEVANHTQPLPGSKVDLGVVTVSYTSPPPPADTGSSSSSGGGGYVVPGNGSRRNTGEPAEVINEEPGEATTEEQPILAEEPIEEEGGLLSITGAAIRDIAGKPGSLIGLIIVILIAGLYMFSNYYGGMPGTGHFNRASNFEKKAAKASDKGNHDKARVLKDKAKALRQKGESLL